MDEHNHRDRCPLTEACRAILFALEMDRVGAPCIVMRINPDASMYRAASVEAAQARAVAQAREEEGAAGGEGPEAMENVD